MLTITKIIEGGINLSTQEELPRCIVVSNGTKEITVPVLNGWMEKIVKLHIESLNKEKESYGHQIVQAAIKLVNEPEPLVSHPNVVSTSPVGNTKRTVQIPTSDLKLESDYDELPPSNVEEDGFQPGEAYEDSGTGAASL